MAGALTDAAGRPIEVPVHPDRRAQAILEQVRERELEQAIARLRLVHRDRPGDRLRAHQHPARSGGRRGGDLERALPRPRCRGLPSLGRGVVGQPERAEPVRAGSVAERRRQPSNGGSGIGVRTAIMIYSRALRTPFRPTRPGACHALARSAVTLVEYRLAGQRGSLRTGPMCRAMCSAPTRPGRILRPSPGPWPSSPSSAPCTATALACSSLARSHRRSMFRWSPSPRR